ncbi:MAG: MBL fold metallo-hydrolase, partial [Eubacteriales bacterium]|nr:MBL fold metallo-hydrolase [Eubacteriales bacterium]
AEQEREVLSDPRANASLMFGQPTIYPQADRYLQDGELIELDSELKLKTFNTPGHTHGSMCFLILRQRADEEETLALITGDTLFDDSFGRTDLASGDSVQLYESLQFLRGVLEKLPPAVPVCPGHGATVSAGELLQSPVWIFAETLK